MKWLPLLLSMSTLSSPVLAQQIGSCEIGKASRDLDVNNVRASIYNTGTFFWRGSGNAYTVPKGGGADAIFLSTIQMGGLVGDEIRFSGSTYGPFVFWPGPLSDQGEPPADCSAYDRIYSILAADVVAYEQAGKMTDDLADWPAHLGAPVIDGDGVAGNYNLGGGDRPELLGDQTLWWVMNDAGGSRASFDTEALPMEIRMTAFAFDGVDDVPPYPNYGRLSEVLRNATFYRFRLVYKGDAPLEDAWFSIWSDTDLGDESDDYVGSDSVLGLGFTYNGKENDDPERGGYGAAPPALGMDFFRGPVLLADDLDNDDDGLVDEQGERGGATRFLEHGHDATLWGWPSNEKEWIDLLRGFWRDGTPMTKGGIGYGGRSRAHFMYSGMPPGFWSEENTDGTGSSNPPSNSHFNLTTGPFSMEPGASEDIYLGIIWSRGKDRLDSVHRLKIDDAVIQTIFDDLIKPRVPKADPMPLPDGYSLLRNHPNPFSDRTSISYDLPRREPVRLTVYDVLGRAVKTLVDGIEPPGRHEVSFEAGDLPPGMYFYELQAGLVRGAQKMVIMR